MIKEKLGHRIDGWVHTLFPFLFWRPINPDVMTVVGTLVAGASGLAFAGGELRLAGLLLVAGGFFDLVDGVVARHFGRTTRFGAFLDSSLDRVVDILVMLGLFTLYVRNSDGVGALVCAWVLVATVLTSYAKARAELMLERMPGGFLERGERIGLLAIGALSGWLWPVLGVLAVGSSVTVGQRFLYAYREMGRLDREAAGAAAGAVADREVVEGDAEEAG
ncbi:MAG: CDP-alcohol phosphatidyltransferase family protein [bacterium]|nr:CDP-alcohol phosphatidyltransferase [Deltaproteobacteria bacterium]MCP4906287.1 CDP-alcohol phosphatidyltransferase family protein [bacterium]